MKIIVKFQENSFNRAQGNRQSLGVKERAHGEDARGGPLGHVGQEAGETVEAGAGVGKRTTVPVITDGIFNLFVLMLSQEMQKARQSF